MPGLEVILVFSVILFFYTVSKSTEPGYLTEEQMEEKSKPYKKATTRSTIVRKHGRFSKRYYSHKFNYSPVDTRKEKEIQQDKKDKAIYLKGARFTANTLATLSPKSVYWDEYLMYYKTTNGKYPENTPESKAKILDEYMKSTNKDETLDEFMVYRKRATYGVNGKPKDPDLEVAD